VGSITSAPWARCESASVSDAMKVAFVLTQDRGGPVDLTVSLAKEFARRSAGPEVVIVGPAPVTSAGAVDSMLRPTWVRSKTDHRGAMELRRVLAAEAPDLVHAQDRRAALMVATIARGRVPVVSTYHGVPDDAARLWVGQGPLAARPVSPRARAMLAVDALVARLTSITVAPSRAMATFLVRRLRLPASKLRVVPNGVALPPVRPLNGSATTFISVGAFAPAKATGVAVDAFARIARGRGGLRLVLVGDGDERLKCQRQVARYGIDPLVEFTGYRTDVPALLARADSFVLPSVNENCPLALIEAMGAGLACVGSGVGGVPELLGDGNGLLVAPGDPEALAGAMAMLADDEALAPALGRAAAATARRHFSVSACADAHQRLWSSLLPAGR
jgi:glycosyltransferase involved in cell wall biosynthesis